MLPVYRVSKLSAGFGSVVADLAIAISALEAKRVQLLLILNLTAQESEYHSFPSE
jgi:hypothetical protein